MKLEQYFNSDYPTSILNLKPSDVERIQSERPLFIWIPGNPGLLEYYEELLQLIHKQNPEWEILGISHAGMSPDYVSRGGRDNKIYSLEEQIEHKIQVINNFTSPSRPLIIMGHSVGAYIAQRIVLSKELVGRVIKLGMLTPTIVDIHTSEKGIIFTKAFHWVKSLPQIAAWGTHFLFNRVIPKLFIRPILSLVMGCHRDSKAVIASSLLIQNSDFVLQALGLATYEMDAIRGDWDFQKQLLDYCHTRDINIWLLFSNSDHWVSNETRRQLIHFYNNAHSGENISIQVSSTIPHSFVVKHSKYIVDTYF